VGVGSSVTGRSGWVPVLAYTRDAWLRASQCNFVFPMRILSPSELSKFDLVVLVVFGVALVAGSLLLLELALFEIGGIYQH
jgi:hypothetical protein